MKWVTIVIIGAFGLNGFANPVSDEAKAEKLVRLLGSDSFRAREKAAKDLVLLGAASKNALEAGLNSSDPEIVERCRKLIPLAYQAHIHKRLSELASNPKAPIPVDLPGSKRWLTMVGTGSESRELYTEMLSNHQEILSKIEQENDKVSENYREFVQNTYQKLRNSTAQNRNNVLTRSEMTLFLFLSTHPKVNSSTNANGVNSYLPVTNILNQSLLPTLLKEDSGSKSIRKLFSNYLLAETNQNVLRRALQIASAANMKECVPIAIRIAKDKQKTGFIRAYALMTLPRLLQNSDLPELLPLLDDDTVVTNLNVGNGVKMIEVRDITLGVLLIMQKQTLTDFSFEQNPPANPNAITLSYSYFRFESPEKRTDALKKWKEYAEKEKLLPPKK